MKKSEEYLKNSTLNFIELKYAVDIETIAVLQNGQAVPVKCAEEYGRLCIEEAVEEHKEGFMSEKAIRFIENNIHDDNMVGFPFVSQNTALYALEINSQHMIDKAAKCAEEFLSEIFYSTGDSGYDIDEIVEDFQQKLIEDKL